MTIDELKSTLTKYRNILDDIRALVIQREELRSLASSIASSLEGGGGHGGDVSRKPERIALKIQSIDEEINEELESLTDEEQRIKSLLNLLEDSKERSVLLYRYIDGYTFERIADKIGKQLRWTMELHDRGLKKLLKKIG